jgi:hypothetical protein
LAIYVIVGQNQSPVNPGEINAGSTIEVNDGDLFSFASTADATVKFVNSTGVPVDFEILFAFSNQNNFDVDIGNDLSADIEVSSGVNLSGVDIKAKDSDAVTLTAGDGVTLGDYEGSELGADTLLIDNSFMVINDIDTRGGNDSISIGDNLTVKDIKTGEGDDTLSIGSGANIHNVDTEEGNDSVTIGNDLTANDIKTGQGNDTLDVGDRADIHNIFTEDGDDSVMFGDDLVANDIKTGKGDDTLTIGNGAVVDDIDTNDGNDSVTLGDNYFGDKVETKKGDDFVIIGSGASIDDLDGGDDEDRLASETNIPDATGFETVVCFCRGTLILTDAGDVPVESLAVGDRVLTLDHGYQEIRWIGVSKVSGTGRLAPVCIRKHTLGNERNLWVSQQHRMLLSDWRTELLFGETEVLVPAKHLVDGISIGILEVESVEYFHMLFDRHELVYGEGILSESFHPGQVGLGSVSEAAREEIFTLFPELRDVPEFSEPCARRSLKAHEAQALVA